jgi:hypothetical protein
MKKFISLHYVNVTESGLTLERGVEVSDVYIITFFVENGESLELCAQSCYLMASRNNTECVKD